MKLFLIDRTSLGDIGQLSVPPWRRVMWL